MITRKFFFMLFFFCCIRLPANGQEDLLLLANSIFSPLPNTMPTANSDTPKVIALGKKLYFETALSINKTQSCNTCHNLLNNQFGVDNLSTSLGALGQKGLRNTPTTVNAGLQFAQFWDGRASSLEEQAKSPILNPMEMALTSKEQAIQRLREANYQSSFKQAFPQQENPLRFENILNAVAAFQRTLISKDRFDEYLRGDDQAISQQEKSGMSLFIQHGCIGCHSGSLLGGEMMQKLGIVNPYPNDRDKGLAEVTHNPADNFMFKVPSLRGVGQTAPYFHDGATYSLQEVVEQTAWHQMGVRLKKEEVENITAFLQSLNNTASLIPEN